MINQNILPINQNQRIVIIDILRGWALIGVVLVNYFLFFYLEKESQIPKNDYLSHFSRLITDIFFTNKSRIMLNVLFGFGFSIMIDKITIKGQNPFLFFGRRMFWLFLIGLVNTCFYYGDFLKDYAIVGIFLLFYYKASATTSLCVAIFLMLLYPFTTDYFYTHFPTSLPETDIKLFQSINLLDVLLYGFKEGTKELYELGRLLGINLFVLACFLFGRFLYKIDFFAKILENKISAKKIFWSSLLSTIFIAIIINVLPKILKTNIFKHYDTSFWLEFGLMFVILSSICWLYKKNKLKYFFASLQAVGKMTLTNYIIQNVISIFLFSGFGLGLLGKLPLYGYILIALSIYFTQTFFSRWWLSKYNYGPIEWIWRQVTYVKKLPLKTTYSRERPTANTMYN